MEQIAKERVLITEDGRAIVIDMAAVLLNIDHVTEVDIGMGGWNGMDGCNGSRTSGFDFLC